MRHQSVTMVLVCALAAPSLASVNWNYFPEGDAGFLALTDHGNLESAVAEGRIGNNATSGTWETAIWELGGKGTPKDTAQAQWASGIAVPFSLTYDGAGSLTYTVDGISTSWDGVAAGFTDIFIRARSVENAAVELSSLDLAGSGLSIGDLVAAGDGVEYLRVTRCDPFGAFRFTGQQTFTWDGPMPSNSALAYQIKLTRVVPEPGSLLLLTGGLLALRRR